MTGLFCEFLCFLFQFFSQNNSPGRDGPEHLRHDGQTRYFYGSVRGTGIKTFSNTNSFDWLIDWFDFCESPKKSFISSDSSSLKLLHFVSPSAYLGNQIQSRWKKPRPLNKKGNTKKGDRFSWKIYEKKGRQSASFRVHFSSRAPLTAAMDALNHAFLLHLGFGHAADAVGPEVGVPRLDAAEAAETFKARLFPLGHQILVGNVLLQAVLVQFFANGLAFVVEVKDVAGLLVVQLEDGPERLDLALALVRLRFRLAHLLVQLLQRGLNQIPSLRRGLGAATDFRHRRNGWGIGRGGREIFTYKKKQRIILQDEIRPKTDLESRSKKHFLIMKMYCTKISRATDSNDENTRRININQANQSINQSTIQLQTPKEKSVNKTGTQ